MSGKCESNSLLLGEVKKWPETDLNRRHVNFQSTALPTELSGPYLKYPCGLGGSKSAIESFDNRKMIFSQRFLLGRRNLT